jgi:hypothetical protein
MLILLLAQCSVFAKPKAKPPPDPAAAVDLPDDANIASLRVSAMDTIYELDLTTAQLHVLHGLAAETADSGARSAATVTPQFLATLKDLQSALLDASDDQRIAKLRNQIIDMADGPDIHLDNDIVTTERARAKSAIGCGQLKASQIAAYIAVHAEEVSDPLELMMSAADGLQELHADATQKPDARSDAKASDPAADADSAIQETSLTVGYLVAGMDSAKAHAVTQQAAQWLRNANSLSDAEFAQRRTALEESAKKIVGDLPPMQVLDNWMQDQMAILLSNPQLPEAIEAILKFRTQGG